MVRIEWNIRKSKCAHRIGYCCSLEPCDRISDLHHGAYNNGAGCVDNGAFDRAACHGLRQQNDGQKEHKTKAIKYGSPHKFSLSMKMQKHPRIFSHEKMLRPM